MPMKIAIVSEYYYPLLGGITEHVHFFSKECARLGHNVTLITSNAKNKMKLSPPTLTLPIEGGGCGRG